MNERIQTQQEPQHYFDERASVLNSLNLLNHETKILSIGNNFPKLVQTFPELSDSDEQLAYCVANRISGARLTAILYNRRHTSIPIHEVISRQFELLIPSEEIAFFTPAIVVNEKQRAHLNRQTAAQIFRDRRASDINFQKILWNYTEKTKTVDLELNKYLALRIVLSPQEFPTPEVLERYVNDSVPDKSINWSALHDGLVGLTEAQTLKGLLDTKTIPPDDIKTFYSNVSYWLTESSLRTTFESKTPNHIFPYSLETSYYPDIEFLPYLLSAYYEYISRLPELVPEGGYFSRSELVLEVNRLLGNGDITAFYNKAAYHALLNDAYATHKNFPKNANTVVDILPYTSDAIQKRIKAIVPSIAAYDKWIKTLVHHYEKNPGLQNKKKSSDDSGSTIQSFSQLIQTIHQEGGRGPKNLVYSFQAGIRSGQED